MAIRKDFVDSCVSLLLHDGVTRESLRLYLNACWSHGASTALLSPQTVFDILGSQSRRAYALAAVEGVVRLHLKERGVRATKKTVQAYISAMLAGDDAYPILAINAGTDDWIIGRRNSN